MKRFWLIIMVLVFGLAAAACGGDSATSAPVTAGSGSSSGGTASACSLRNRQDFAFATLNEWYLFPETLPTALDPTPYSTVGAYIDALTATARGLGKDRYFTYVTSIADENAFFGSGSSAGFGVRLTSDATANRLYIAEAFEGAPALAAGIDRGDEITAIGTTPSTMRLVSDIIAAEGTAGVNTAIGPTTAGTTRTLRVVNASGTRDLTVTKTDYILTPVSTRYGSKIITDGTRRIGYLNLRTFISTADPALRAAFDQFRAQGITEFVIDFRYNGGGLVSTAELLGDLLGGNRSSADIFSKTTFRPSKSVENSVHAFTVQPQAVSPVRIAFIGTGGTASASELVINAFIPYLGNQMALVGGNTYGKPVGQIAVDKAACDDRIRVIAFALQNAAGNAAYFSGLASSVANTCLAADDISHALGDPLESSTKSALDFLAGRACTPIASGGQTSQSVRGARELLMPAAPTVGQREVPGMF
jgi:carboxyl-terminal processing protease